MSVSVVNGQLRATGLLGRGHPSRADVKVLPGESGGSGEVSERQRLYAGEL